MGDCWGSHILDPIAGTDPSPGIMLRKLWGSMPRALGFHEFTSQIDTLISNTFAISMQYCARREIVRSLIQVLRFPLTGLSCIWALKMLEAS